MLSRPASSPRSRALTRASLLLFSLLSATVPFAAAAVSLAETQEAAAPFKIDIALPHFERTPEEIAATAEAAIQKANTALDALAAQDLSKVTFESSIVTLDRILFDARNTLNRLGLLKETLEDKAARDTASDMTVKLSTWSISLEYRDDIYRVIKAYADQKPELTGEDKLLLDETLRDYRRAGLSLPPEERQAVERLRKELAELTTRFSTHVVEAQAPLVLTAEEAAGIPQSFLESPGVRQEDGTYRAMINVTWHWEAVIENAKDPEIRRRAHVLRYTLAKEKNVPLLANIVALRTEIARRLGYPTWADYQIEPRMAKTAAAARAFEEDLIAGLEIKYRAEIATLQKLKAEDLGQADARLEAWDIPYYTDKLKKSRYAVDTQALRVYFPYEASLTGMFRLYENLFGLAFTEVTPPETWAKDVQLYLVKDHATHEPLGFFYLDMFPREGKYNHFACFQIADGAREESGRQTLPIAALACNFTPASATAPSLLKHDEVETLFHEFGHVMHHMLGRSEHRRHYAFNVEQDFVEAPSQMLENWVWDKGVLDTFAADYRDPAKKVPSEIIDALNAARVATSGLFYRRQLSFGVLDLALHTQTEPNPSLDITSVTNAELARVWAAPGPDTAFVAYFGHLAGGYDAGYYGYLWSLAIAQDLASVFAQSPKGLLDPVIGRRLRDEIYAVAASRPAEASVRQFLGREPSLKAFLEYVGAAPAK